MNLTDGVPDPLGSLGLVTRFAAAFVPSQTPAQQTQALTDRVNALVTGGVLNKGQANGLTQPLQNALRSLLINKLAPACSQLSDFQHDVNGLAPASSRRYGAVRRRGGDPGGARLLIPRYV